MLKSKLNLLSKTLLLTAVALSMFSFSAFAEEVVLKAGTAVPMQLVNTVNGKDVAVGQIVDFRVTSDIKVGQTVVIEAGAIARAFGSVLEFLNDNDNGVFGCMSLIACHDVCPKELPLQSKIAYLRRKMVSVGMK